MLEFVQHIATLMQIALVVCILVFVAQVVADLRKRPGQANRREREN